MSVFSATMAHRSFLVQISALCFVLGLLLAAAWNTTQQLGRTGAPGRTGFYIPNLNIGKDKESEITKLRRRVNDLESTEKGTGRANTALNRDLQDTKLFAGLTDVEGPGVQVTLIDSIRSTGALGGMSNLAQLIHDDDIARVVNELKASGAEAISVNGQRVVGWTAIRCVGPVVQVNFEPCAPPYHIQAIGNADQLLTGLNLQGGVLADMRRFDPRMVRIEKLAKIHLPPYSGSTHAHVARAITASSTSKEDTK